MKTIKSILFFFKCLFLSEMELRNIKEERLAKKESWGVFCPSISGRQWFLGRRQNWHVAHESNPDSKPLLIELGFRILGIADNMRYCVEPPEGFQMIQSGEVWNTIYNNDGKKVLSVFEKNEPWDFRCFVCVPKL